MKNGFGETPAIQMAVNQLMHLYQISSLSLPITFSYCSQSIHTLGSYSRINSAFAIVYRPYFDILRLAIYFIFKDNILITMKSYLESLGSQTITSNIRNLVTINLVMDPSGPLHTSLHSLYTPLSSRSVMNFPHGGQINSPLY